MHQVFLSLIIYQLAGFGQLMTLEMLQHLFRSYRVIYEIYLEENLVKMMGPNDTTETLACLINQLKKGRQICNSRRVENF